MAHLNVRERRVEATIAYLGPAGAGKATNVRQIGMRATPRAATPEVATGDDAGEELRLDWTAPPTVQFRDCSLTVKVRAAQGDMSPARTRAMLGGADGVVLILDAHPSAREANQASVDAVRAVAEARTPPLPVVVQVNKVDHPEALPAAEVAEAYANGWPWLSASAESGQGVVETLERALEGVLANLQADGHNEAAPPRPNGPRVEGNPLLAALRQVLRETVREHVAELEVRFAAQLERSLVQQLMPIGAMAAEVGALRQTMVNEIAESRTALDEIRERLEQVRRNGAETGSALAVHAKETARGISQQTVALAGVVEKLPEGGAIEALAREVGSLATVVRGQEQSAMARITELAKGLGEISRGIAELRKGLEKPPLADAKIQEVSRAVGALGARVESIGPALNGMGTDLRRTIGDDVDQRLTAMEKLVRRAAAEAEQAGARMEQGTGEVVTRLDALREELMQKRADKKGWFG